VDHGGELGSMGFALGIDKSDRPLEPSNGPCAS
jgi:hypothetical protein